MGLMLDVQEMPEKPMLPRLPFVMSMLLATDHAGLKAGLLEVVLNRI